MKKFVLLAICAVFLTGCGKFSPLSPNLKQQLHNQNGQIEELKNNQNGLMLDIGKLKQITDINARDIENYQQGLLNMKNSHDNSGVQILQGDGALIVVFALGTIAMLLIYHYRSKAIQHEKTASILAQQIANYGDEDLDNKVFMSALNSDVEENIYHLMVKCQADSGKKTTES